MVQNTAFHNREKDFWCFNYFHSLGLDFDILILLLYRKYIVKPDCLMLIPLLLLAASGLVWVAWLIFKTDHGTDDQGDGGSPIDVVPPDLDLPPGVCLPSGDAPEPTHRYEEELAC